MNSISERVLRLREEKKYSRKDLAELAEVSQPTIYNIENGKTDNITLSVGKKIANALEISFGELFEIETNTIELENFQNDIDKLLADLEKKDDEISDLLVQIEMKDSWIKNYERLNSTYDLLNETHREERKELKRFRGLFSLIESFELINMDEFIRHNTCSITSEDLITTIKLKAILSFYNTYGTDANSELTKYFDIEKFKKSERFKVLKNFHEGSESWTKERILQWVIQEKKKLLENSKSE